MFVNFSHNRNLALEDEIIEFKGHIDAFVESSGMANYFTIASKAFGIPEDVVKQEFKKQISETYNWKKGCFPAKLFLSSLGKYVFKTMAYFFYILLNSRSSLNRESCDLMIEWVEADLEIRRFENLYKKFENPLIITMKKLNSPLRTLCRPLYKFYDTRLVLHSICNFLLGLLSIVQISFKIRVNLLAVHLIMIDTYLYYASLFQAVCAKFMIQERHYHAGAMKTALFKKYGGSSCATIQKNIIHAGYSGFYYDIDHFFSLGKGTYQRAIQQGGILREITPVGSMFMEYSWFTVGGRRPAAVYDVVSLGLNIIDFHDSYDSYLSDYYEHICWLVKFANKFPQYSIGIKHHANNLADPREKTLIKGSRVIDIPPDFNSYEYSFAAKCTVSWGSTMGYELLGHGVYFLFLDPGKRNFGFLPYDKELNSLRVTSYEEFEDRLLNILEDRFYKEIDRDFFCLRSDKVAENIWRKLQESGRN